MKFTHNLKKINNINIKNSGGKGYSLSKMISWGLLVPDGFVILSSSFDYFCKENMIAEKIKKIIKKIDVNDNKSIDSASLELKKLIFQGKMPQKIEREILESFSNLNTLYVAVRSSSLEEDGLNKSWAGQMESFLNTKENYIIEHVKRCWGSAFSSRALFYGIKNGFEFHKKTIAVVVQEMIYSDKSGVAFSANPVSGDTNQIVIEATFGLGESLVSGMVTPDLYIINKKNNKLIEKKIGKKNKITMPNVNGGCNILDLKKGQSQMQVLSDSEFIHLSKIVKKIEEKYNNFCDIEWVYKEKFYIVQCRPITTIKG